MTVCAHEPVPYQRSWVCPLCGAVGELTADRSLQHTATVPAWRLDVIRRARAVGLPAHAPKDDVELVESGRATVIQPLPWDRPHEPYVSYPLRPGEWFEPAPAPAAPPDDRQLALFEDAS